MQILALIDRLDNLVYEARPLPFGNAIRLDREQVFELLDQLRVLVDDELTRTRVQSQRPGGLEQVARALEESDRPVPPPLTAVASDQVREVVRTAEDAAEKIRTEARRDAELVAAECAEKRAAGDRVRAEADELLAAAREQREAAEAEAERIIAQAERIRSEATRSAAALGREQLERMQASASELADKVAAAEALAPAAVELKAELEALRDRIGSIDEPTRALGTRGGERKGPPRRPDDAPAVAADGMPTGDRPLIAARVAESA